MCESATGIHYTIASTDRCFGEDRRVTLTFWPDSFGICMRDEDTTYLIVNENQASTCLKPEDVAYRCLLIDASVVHTHSVEACGARGGRALGVSPETDRASDNK